VARPDHGEGAPVDRERQHEALVVVGVLADQVDAAGRRPDAHRLAPEGRPELVPHELAQILTHAAATASRSRSAASSGTISATLAPIAASEPARNLSRSGPRRGEVSCSMSSTVSRPSCTGAWCHAAMYGVG